jgi:hypothetical protein
LKKIKAGYRRASFLWQDFMWQVIFAKCTCVFATNFIWQVFIRQVLITGVNVPTSLLWQFISSQLVNHIKCSDYTLTSFLCWPMHTDEQNLYFDNFFYDKCTWSKASRLLLNTCTCHRKNCQSCAYRRANKTCQVKTCHRKHARL